MGNSTSAEEESKNNAPNEEGQRARESNGAMAHENRVDPQVGHENRGQHNAVDGLAGEEVDIGYWYIARNGYSQLVNLIIRPPRATYDIADLGPNEFEFGGKRFMRTDFQLTNKRSLKLECSHWEPTPEDRPAEQLPCLIYLHGNSSCRAEALSVLRVGLASGMTVFALDFTGCGKSEGEYISLGFFEKDDLQAATDYLRASNTVSTIGLWGRSMGAATSLLHGDRDPSIAGIVLDSAFADLEQLAKELVEHGKDQGFTIPSFLVKIVLRMIRSSVAKKANFDIRELVPIAHADKTFIPALFVHGESDTFIRPHHSKQIYDKYAGDKNIIYVQGDHNSVRPQFLYDSVAIFLQAALQIPMEYQLVDAVTNGLPPWLHGFSRHADISILQAAIEASMNDIMTTANDDDPSLKNFIRGSGEEMSSDEDGGDEWSCIQCTYINSHSGKQCLICGSARCTMSQEENGKVSSDYIHVEEEEAKVPHEAVSADEIVLSEFKPSPSR